jgi:hypothetical protein
MKNRAKRYAKRRTIEILYNLRRPSSLSQLIDNHFSTWSETDHQCRTGITKALEGLTEIDNPVIVETGTSAYGTDSSRIFTSDVKLFKGIFYSVDISPAPSKRLRHFKNKNSFFFVLDSVHFLNNFSELTNQKFINLVYLDSWDVEWANPEPSARHGLKEFQAVDKLLNLNSYLLIDDTPGNLFWIPELHHEVALEFKKNYGVFPGKGSFVLRDEKFLSHYEVVFHGYNLLARRIR